MDKATCFAAQFPAAFAAVDLGEVPMVVSGNGIQYQSIAKPRWPKGKFKNRERLKGICHSEHADRILWIEVVSYW